MSYATDVVHAHAIKLPLKKTTNLRQICSKGVQKSGLDKAFVPSSKISVNSSGKH
jgi:hypothetical protein